MQIEDSPELAQLAQESSNAWASGDGEWLRSHVSAAGPVVIGSAPGEEVQGAEVAEALRSAVAGRDSWPFAPTGHRIVDARQCGDVGWSIAENKWEFEDGSYVPARAVTIWHREDGDWKMVVGVVAAAFSNDLLHAGSPVTQSAETTVST